MTDKATRSEPPAVIDEFHDQDWLIVVEALAAWAGNPNDPEILTDPRKGRAWDLMSTIASERDFPESIRELARLLERNVSPVHSDLTKLESYGLIAFEHGDNRAKQPVVPYDRIRIDVATADETDRAVASGSEHA